MPDSSDRVPAPLTNVLPRNAYRLLTIVRESKLRQRAFIAQRYREAAQHFDETLTFLDQIGWITLHGDEVSLANFSSAQVLNTDGILRGVLTVQAVLGHSSPFRRALAKYLTHFEATEQGLTHRPSVEQRLADHSVRDFLIDLGAVSHDRDGDHFVLAEPFAHLALLARSMDGPSRTELALNEEERSLLGRGAELVVVEWEQRRLGSALHDRVIHVAAVNPFACFDIQSVTQGSEGESLRFIEVKAVSEANYGFHWSAGEIEAAKLLGDRYFLYLLPATGHGSFDTARLEIIQDAYAEFFHRDSLWCATPSDFICRKRKDIDS